MPTARVQIQLGTSTNPIARDWIMNTFYLGFGSVFTDDDWDQLAEDAATVWKNRGSYPNYINVCRATLYDMADAKPRAPKAIHDVAIAGSGEGGPREVAVCLSYYAGRNIPRLRGRMYIGPWQQADMMERPAAVRTQAMGIATGIAALGGLDCDWKQYSPTNNLFTTVSDYWCDNEWDTMRSRGLRGDTRLVASTSG